MVNNRLDLTKEPIQVKSYLNPNFSTVSPRSLSNSLVSPKATKSVSLKCVAESRASILGHCMSKLFRFWSFHGIYYN